MKEPIIVYGIDITETIKKQFASGAMSVTIYGRTSSPIATIDKDGNVTKTPAAPDDAEA
jgi:hypothetical protein